MKMGLWTKLAIVIVTMIAIILLSALILSQQSIKKGFLVYINSTEQNRIEHLSRMLRDEYRFYGSWDFIEDQPRQWSQYLRRSKPKPDPRSRGEKPYPLHELATRNPDGRPRERSDDHFERRARHLFDDDRPPRKKKPRGGPTPTTALLDANKTLLVKNKGRLTKDAIDHPITIQDRVVGYVRYQPFKKITKSLDQQFIKHQREAFIKIAISSMLLILLGAWIIGRYLKRRLSQLETQAHALTAGNYAYRSNSQKTDELASLAKHMDELAKTLEKNQQARRQWIADISHELRTPLSILQGEVEAIFDGIRPLNEKTLHSISQEVQHLSSLVNDLYQLSSSDVGALSYNKRELYFTDIVDDVVASFTERLEQAQLKLIENIDNCNPCLIEADYDRLKQLLINLLENSIRYTDAGGEIHLSCFSQVTTFEFIIEDSAPGVSSTQLPKLFDRLYRGENSRNRATGGSGLGLAICKKIVEAHHGTIDAGQSSFGGLKMTLQFPMRKQEGEGA